MKKTRITLLVIGALCSASMLCTAQPKVLGREMWMKAEHRKVLSSPIWPDINPAAETDPDKDAALIETIKSAVPTDKTKLGLNDTVMVGEAIHHIRSKAWIGEKIATRGCLLFDSKVNAYDFERISRIGYSNANESLRTDTTYRISIPFRSDLCFSPNISPPVQEDTAGLLRSTFAGFLFLEHHILEAIRPGVDTMQIPQKASLFFLNGFYHNLTVQQTLLIACDDTAATYQLSLSFEDDGAIYLEQIELGGEVRISKEKDRIIFMKLRGETAVSPVDTFIPLEGYGSISILIEEHQRMTAVDLSPHLEETTSRTR